LEVSNERNRVLTKDISYPQKIFRTIRHCNFSFLLLFSFFLCLRGKESLVKIAKDVVLGLLAGCCLGFLPGNGGWTSMM
jgi:hypothetical protein